MNLRLILVIVVLLPLSLMAQSWAQLNQKVLDLSNKGENDSAVFYGKKALQKAEVEFGKKHFNYIRAVFILAVAHDLNGNFAIAEPLYLQALAIEKEVLGTSDPVYMEAVAQMAAIYKERNDLPKAILFLSQLADLVKQASGAASAGYAKAIEDLAAAYDDNGEYEKAEPLFIQCKTLRKTIFGELHLAYGSVLSNMALLYSHLGRYKEAKVLYNQSLNILEKNGLDSSTHYSATLNNLASLYCDMGEFEEAESLYIQALVIDEKEFGIFSQQYALSVNNIATYYFDIGENEKATTYFLMALDINRRLLGETNPAVASVLSNLGQLYQRTGEYDKAEKYCKDAIRVMEQTVGKDHSRYATSVLSLASLFYHQKKYKEAEGLFITALQTLKTSLGELHPTYASSINNLAVIYTETGRYKESETLLLKALAIAEKNGNDPNLVNYNNNLALVYQHTGQYEKVEQLFGKALQISLGNLQKNFSFLTEQEKEKYSATILQEFNGYQSFYYNYYKQKPSIAGTAYNLELSTKGMILNTGVEMRQAVQNSSDKEAVAIYNDWAILKTSLAKEYALPAEKRRADMKELVEKVNSYEQVLTRLSSIFKEAAGIGKIKWNDIQQKLKEKEVAVEFASFKYRNKDGWTDSTLYMALVLRKGDVHPAMIPLCEAKQLDSLMNNPNSTNQNFITALYRGLDVQSMQPGMQSKKLYQLIWKPLDHLLSANDVIYFAPSGILNQVAFAAIPWDSATLLSDRYQMQQVSSTAMLLKETKVTPAAVTSVTLFGGIQYTLTEQEMAATAIRQKSVKENVSRSLMNTAKRGDAWNYLPGTLAEVKAIATAAMQQKIKTTLYAGIEATEEVFKNNSGQTSPSIIHVASHGFFFPDPQKEIKKNMGEEEQVFRSSDNPLNRSGIILAGANRAWNGETLPEGMEDGILTAYEAGNLNFGKTQLVVLSACETGLGDIKGSEGVFGLQRSFKMAGVEYLLMSLWKVPDAETAEFMQFFYTALFSGKTIPVSFHDTQEYMKKKYPKNPYKWAAFVLLR